MASAKDGHAAQSADTNAAADRIQFEIYRSWSTAEKLEAMARLWRGARELSLTGLRLRFPQASEAELELREAALRIGEPLARKVYGERFAKLDP